jgi:hypothetical protein
MARVAFYTIGLLITDSEDPQVQGFWDRVDAVFKKAESSEGFLGRSSYDDENSAGSWGIWTAPPVFQKDEYNNRRPATLSLWQDLESVFAFAYNGLHGEALSKRREWFARTEWPVYTAWWVEDNHIPTWQEASERQDRLTKYGPTPEAFNFKQPFGSDGQPLQLDREVIKSKAALQSKQSGWMQNL